MRDKATPCPSKRSGLPPVLTRLQAAIAPGVRHNWFYLAHRSLHRSPPLQIAHFVCEFPEFFVRVSQSSIQLHGKKLIQQLRPSRNASLLYRQTNKGWAVLPTRHYSAEPLVESLTPEQMP